MLDKLDLSKKISKSESKTTITELENQAGQLQRDAHRLSIPIIILFEGWEAAGKGTLINKLTLALDSRGFKVYPVKPADEEEKFRPYLWRFWKKIPARGQIAIFDKSWCGQVLEDRVNQTLKPKVWQKAYDEILSFERQLTSDGYLIIKFFLHISKQEQKKRFQALLDNPSTQWRITEKDKKHHKHYQEYLTAYEDMLTKTHTEAAPWTIIEAHDRRYATIKILKTLNEMAAKKIEEIQRNKKAQRKKKLSSQPLQELSVSILDKVDLSLTLSREEYKAELSRYQEKMRELEHAMYTRRIPVVIVYQGWDAGGKGGNIRRLVQKMDPRGYEVVPIGAPNVIENQYHYLWRFWIKFPKAGHIHIFDRSWYGRVMVERIEGFCTEEEWKRAYFEINEMEEQWANFGTVIFKFWLHISKEEQMKRFQAREHDPFKTWKINQEDWRNRDKWDEYKQAVDEMLYRTSTSYAPWTIIEANSKLYARIKVLKTVTKTLEKLLR